MPGISTFADLSSRGTKNSQGFVRTTTGFSSVSNKAAGTATTLTGLTVAAGDLIIVFLAWDPTGASVPTLSTVTDTVGTTYTSMGPLVSAPATTSSGSGVLSQAYWGIVPSGVSSATTITLTLSATSGNKAAVGIALKNARQSLVNPRTTTASTGTTATFPTSIANTGDMVLTFIGVENNSAPTGASDTTRGTWVGPSGANSTGGSAAANLGAFGQYKIVTGQGPQQAVYGSLSNNWGLHTYVVRAA